MSSTQERSRLIEAIRARPGMYVGGTDRLGLVHLHEYVIRSLLEANTPPRGDLTIRFDAGRVWFETSAVIDADAAIGCLDSGAVPVHRREPWWYLLTVSTLSSSFAIEVQSVAGWWSWTGARGVRVAAPEPATRRSSAGTVISFTPDRDVFSVAPEVTAPQLSRRLEQLALLHPGLLVTVEDPASGFRFSQRLPRGMADWLELHNAEVLAVIETAWNDVKVRAAVGRGPGVPPLEITSFANDVPTRDGPHVQALRTAVNARWGAEANLAVIAVDMAWNRLAFSGPTQEVLALEGLRSGVRAALRKAFPPQT